MKKKFYMGKIRKTAALLAAVSLLTCAAGTGIYSSAEEVKVQGNVNSDGAFNSLDALLFRKWMLGFDDEDFSGIGAGDLNEDGIPDIRDLCVMKSRLLSPENTQTEKIRVTTVEELKTALENAKPGDEIIVAEGEYIYSGSTAKGFMYKAEADGWGQNASVYGNRVWMDTNINALGKKMYFLNSWNCTCTVWDNFMAYDGELFSVDNEADRRNYYNCNMIEYGESSLEKDT